MLNNLKVSYKMFLLVGFGVAGGDGSLDGLAANRLGASVKAP